VGTSTVVGIATTVTAISSVLKIEARRDVGNRQTEDGCPQEITRFITTELDRCCSYLGMMHYAELYTVLTHFKSPPGTARKLIRHKFQSKMSAQQH
jgi:hypothetical protein